MKYKDFKSALEFLLDYGFEYCYDSATGKRKCYKNRLGEIVLDYKQLDQNDWIPQICVEINYWKQVIDIEREYSALSKKRKAILIDYQFNDASLRRGKSLSEACFLDSITILVVSKCALTGKQKAFYRREPMVVAVQYFVTIL